MGGSFQFAMLIMLVYQRVASGKHIKSDETHRHLQERQKSSRNGPGLFSSSQTGDVITRGYHQLSLVGGDWNHGIL